MSEPRLIDARDRVTGRLELVPDVALPGMLHAALTRGTRPHALVTRVDTEAARRVPGVKVVLTGADIAGLPIRTHFGPVLRDQPILAIDKVRFVGEPVAAVAASSLEAAREAAASSRSSTRSCRPSSTSMRPSTRARRSSTRSCREGGPTFRDVVLNRGDGANVCNHFKLRKGDVEPGIRRGRPRLRGHVLDPGRPARPARDPRLRGQRRTRARGHPLGHDPDARTRSRPRSPSCSTSPPRACGSSCRPWAAATAASATRRSSPSRPRSRSRPAPRSGSSSRARRSSSPSPSTRADHAHDRPRHRRAHRRPASDLPLQHRRLRRHRPARDQERRLRHRRAARDPERPGRLVRGLHEPPARRRVPRLRPGQAAWAYETQMDMIAERLGIDPLELRLRNLLRDGDDYQTGERLQDCHCRAAPVRGGGDRLERRQAPVRANGQGPCQGVRCIIKGR